MCIREWLINLISFNNINSLEGITKVNKRGKLVHRCGLLTFVCSYMLRGVCVL
jgi:hypothetical protein